MNDQLTLLDTKCPMKNCNFNVTESIFKKCLADDKKLLSIYKKCILRNFTESNIDIKMCPNPDCNLCVKLPGHGMYEIKCQCGALFCFKCLKESHRPCECFIIDMWNKKNNSESENSKWLVLNTKQCPNCHKYIEKNQGCNHMTCRKSAGGCGYEFCWICLGEWAPHGSSYFKCEKYDPNKEDEIKKKLKNEMKFELEKYINYFDNYTLQNNSQKYVLNLKDKIKDMKESLEKEKNLPYSELGFLDEALNTVIDCHRILKNIYVFGYYMKQNINKKALIEYNQYMLNRECDLLHELLELESLPNIIMIEELEQFNKEFMKYKGHVISLISSISQFRKNILEDIENDDQLIDYDFIKKEQKAK